MKSKSLKSRILAALPLAFTADTVAQLKTTPEKLAQTMAELVKAGTINFDQASRTATLATPPAATQAQSAAPPARVAATVPQAQSAAPPAAPGLTTIDKLTENELHERIAAGQKALAGETLSPSEAALVVELLRREVGRLKGQLDKRGRKAKFDAAVEKQVAARLAGHAH